MDTNELLAAIDTEIIRLTQVRDLLGAGADGSSAGATNRISSRSSGSSEPKRLGRPKGSKNKSASFNPEEFAPKRRTLSAAGKERMAAAQQARWAKQKGPVKKSRSAATNAAAKKTLGSKQAAKKTSAPAKKLATKLPSKSAVPANPAATKKEVARTKPEKKVMAKPAVKTLAKKFAPRKQAAAKANTSPAPASQNSVAAGATTAAAE